MGCRVSDLGGKVRAIFQDGNDDDEEILDLVVGADGAWSQVGRHILKEKGDEKRWIPESVNTVAIYGISSITCRGSVTRRAKFTCVFACSGRHARSVARSWNLINISPSRWQDTVGSGPTRDREAKNSSRCLLGRGRGRRAREDSYNNRP